MAIKLIAIDMDGTLLLPDHTILQLLKMRSPQLAPGRECRANDGSPYAGVHNYLKELHMESAWRLLHYL